MPLIYDSSWQKKSGVVFFSSPKKNSITKLKKILKLTGRSLVILSFVGLLLTYFPIMALEVQEEARKLWLELKPQSSGFDLSVVQALPTPTPTPEPLPPENKRFQLIIPKIGADACILPNIDPGNQKDYSLALQKCVAHAKGSGLPGEINSSNQTIYLFAHSTNAPYNITRYNAVFYSLKDLEIGNEIILWFWDRKFSYIVFEKKILEAKDITYFQPQTKENRLVLQTCYPPGTVWKQLIIIAKPI